jgi:hypothetical protein
VYIIFSYHHIIIKSSLAIQHLENSELPHNLLPFRPILSLFFPSLDPNMSQIHLNIAQPSLSGSAYKVVFLCCFYILLLPPCCRHSMQNINMTFSGAPGIYLLLQMIVWRRKSWQLHKKPWTLRTNISTTSLLYPEKTVSIPEKTNQMVSVIK